VVILDNTKFEKQLWAISDLTRGNIEVTDQKYYIMAFLTMRKIEKQSKYNIPNEMKWSNLISHGLGIGMKIEDAVKKIEKLNPDLEGVFTQVQYSHLDDSYLFRLANEVNRLDVPTDSENLSSSLLYFMASAEGRTGGEYITPTPIVDIITSLFKGLKGSIYDGTAGVNQLLIESARKADGEIRLYGQEINTKTWALGKMNLILTGYDEIATIKLGDTIRNPLFMKDGRLQTFDYVFMNPPFSLSNWGREEAERDLYGRFLYGIPSKSNGDLAFVLQGLASLNKKGKAAIVVTHGALSRGGADQRIRQELLNDDVVEVVIGLPNRLFFGTSISASILILNKNKDESRKGKVQFINAEDDFKELTRSLNTIPSEYIQKIVDFYNEGEELKGYSKSVSIDEIQNAILSVKQYFAVDEITTTIGTVEVDLNAYEESKMPKVPLKQLGEFFRGYSVSAKAEPKNPTHKIIQLGDVQDGRLKIEDMDSIELTDVKKISSYEVREGDVLISSRGSVIKVAVVPKVNESMILTQNFIGLRPRKDVNPYFIKAFLESPIGNYYLSLKQKGTAVQIINKKDLEDILIPNLDVDRQNDIAESFIRSDENLFRAIQKAKELHRNEYIKLYNEMGISGAYTR